MGPLFLIPRIWYAMRDTFETREGRRQRMSREAAVRRERLMNTPILAITVWLPAFILICYGASAGNSDSWIGAGIFWFFLGTLLVGGIIVKLRERTDEQSKTVRNTSKGLQEHRQFELHVQQRQSIDASIPHTTSGFNLSPERAAELFKSIIDGKQVHNASSVPLPTLLAVALNFKIKAPGDIRVLIMDLSRSSDLASGLIFTSSAMLYQDNGLLSSNYDVPFPSLVNWEFSYATRNMSWGESAAAKMLGANFQRLQLSGICKKEKSWSQIGSMGDSLSDDQLTKFHQVLLSLQRAILDSGGWPVRHPNSRIQF